jgi:uncharacterized protein YndB with AHSA1/START domain/uncharacterized damage-inducible protein DinB
MTTTTESTTTVQKSVTVNADVDHAFKVFTEEFDTWWPRGHHIGKKPMQKAVIEPRVGGRCFGREADGVECQWGTVTAWEPPRRLMFAWHIAPNFQVTDVDPSKSSEVEVRFTPEANGMTRVDLEHRHLERHGADFEKLRTSVAGPGGWGGLLHMFGRKANVYHPSVAPVAFILAGNDALADRTFAGVAPDDLWKRPTPNTNGMLWIFGHMAAVRARMLAALGEDFDPGLDLFGRGATLQDTSAYPSREKINEASREVNRRLFARLATLTDADLSRPAQGPHPNSVQTVGEQIAFFALHDSYHVGQLAYVRKALGLPGVVG